MNEDILREVLQDLGMEHYLEDAALVSKGIADRNAFVGVWQKIEDTPVPGMLTVYFGLGEEPTHFCQIQPPKVT